MNYEILDLELFCLYIDFPSVKNNTFISRTVDSGGLFWVIYINNNALVHSVRNALVSLITKEKNEAEIVSIT